MKLLASSSFGAGGPAELSFLGFRPGLGLAGITHSFDAADGFIETKQLAIANQAYLLPIASRPMLRLPVTVQ